MLMWCYCYVDNHILRVSCWMSITSTVESSYDTAQYNSVAYNITLSKWNLEQTFNSRNTTPSLPMRVSHEMSFVSILEKNLLLWWDSTVFGRQLSCGLDDTGLHWGRHLIAWVPHVCITCRCLLSYWHGHTFHITGGFPSQRDSDADLWCFLWC